MHNGIQNNYKEEILDNVVYIKQQLEEIDVLIESDIDWKKIHRKIKRAIQQLKIITKMLIQYHLEKCILEKNIKRKNSINEEDINEIIKTFKYIN